MFPSFSSTKLMTSFKPLLLAEYEEEEKILLQRLEHWSWDRLEKEGYMLHQLGASPMEKQPKNVEGVVWTFNKVGKADNKGLPFNKIELVYHIISLNMGAD